MPDVRELLTRKVGPLPAWVWVIFVAAGAGAFMIVKRNKAGVAGQPSNPQSGQGQFQSSQSRTTTDAQGNTTTSQYSASGQAPFGIPGYLTQQGYPMPYSLGDIYNNISTSVGTTVPVTLPAPVTPPPPSQVVIQAPPPQPMPPPAPTPQPSPAPAPANWWDPGQVWVVDPGDSLWYIAKRILTQRLGREPNNGEIANYWPAIYNANRGVIGGNPNLIRPGQQLVEP